MDLKYAMLARYAEIHPDNTITLIGGDFDTVRGISFPLVVPAAVVATVQAAEENGGGEPVQIFLDVCDPNGKSMLDEPIVREIKPVKIGKRHSAKAGPVGRIVLNLGGIPIPAPGNYEVKLRVGENPCQFEVALPIFAEEVQIG